MENLISTTGLSGLTSLSEGNTTTGSLPAVLGEHTDSEGFSEIFSQQGLSAEIIEKLKGFLPEGQLKKLESLFADGKLLPQVAEVAAKIEAILTDKGFTPEVLEQLQALVPEEKQGQLKAIFWGNKPVPEEVSSIDGEQVTTPEEAQSEAEPEGLEPAITQTTDPQVLTPAMTGTVTTNNETPPQRGVILDGEVKERPQTLSGEPQLRETPLSALNLATPKDRLPGDEKLPPEVIKQFLERGEGVAKAPVARTTHQDRPDEPLPSLIRGTEATLSDKRLSAVVADRNILELPTAANTVRIAPVLSEGIPQLVSGSTSLPLVNQPVGESQAVQRSEVPLPINTPPGSKGWDSAVGDRILWMVGQKSQSASIRINPPHLGPIEVHVTVQKDQASVNFTALHGVVRDALETAIPRLREMFNDNNLQLVNVDVSQKDAGDQRSLQDFSRQHEGEDGQLAGADGGQVGHSGIEDETLTLTQHLEAGGRVDYYA
ncbi:MAG: flagellar hook-length control protein FliK [Candidatus Sedimenticola sp. (ex Thyasira tokunagai)]